MIALLEDTSHKDVTALFASESTKDFSGTSRNRFSRFKIPAMSEELWKNNKIGIRFFSQCDRMVNVFLPRAERTHLNTRYLVSLIHISEPTRLGMISYAVFCLKKKKKI